MKRRSHLAVVVVLFIIAVAWTWPAALGEHLLGHHPDAAGTAWFIDAAPRLLRHGLHDPATAWPTGAHYPRPDSFVLLLLGPLLAPLSAARALGIVSLVGVFTTALATEHLAVTLGAKRPWTLVAALGVACSGLASTALLEGYPYHLLNPWLPLFAAAWWRSTGPLGTARDGVWTGIFFVGCLLSTAWGAIACVPLGIGLLVGARGRGWTRALPAAAATAVVPIVLYVALFSSGDSGGATALADAGFPTPDLRLTLARLAPPGPSIDLHGYTQSATLPATALALSLVAPRVLHDDPGWRRLGLAAVVCLVASLLPAVVGWAVGFEWIPQDGVLSVIFASLVRFPDRLSWGTLIGLSAIGARTATALVTQHPAGRFVGPLLLLAALSDAFIVPRMPVRQLASPAHTPSAYLAHQGPVLDLWPIQSGPAPAWTLWTTNLGCYHQAHHGRPIADLCLVSPGVDSPRLLLQAAVIDRVLSGDADAVAPLLKRLGFGSVVLHTDVFAPQDAGALERGLAAALDSSPVISTDGGERLVAFSVPGATTVSVAEAQAAWREVRDAL